MCTENCEIFHYTCAYVFFIKNNIRMSGPERRHSRRVFSGVRVPLLIIENHCNPISSPRGWCDVKSRRSRLRSFPPQREREKERESQRETPIPTNKAVPRQTYNNTAATCPGPFTLWDKPHRHRIYTEIHISFPYGDPRITIHCKTHVVDLSIRLFITTDEDVFATRYLRLSHAPFSLSPLRHAAEKTTMTHRPLKTKVISGRKDFSASSS